jgi:hypothetical protein
MRQIIGAAALVAVVFVAGPETAPARLGYG